MSETTRKDHLIKGLTQEVRFDGRKNEEYRKITIEYGISKNAEGSAKVTIGETVVLAGVKMSIEKPYADRAEEGSLMVEGELRAMSNPHFEPGPPSIQAIELARVVDRGIREAKAVDFKKLCIEKGEKAWFVSIDVVTINDAGNLLDAAGIAAIAALKDARFPKYDGTAVNYKELTKEKLPIVKIPIPITVIKIGNNLIVDPTNEEEEFIDTGPTVASIEDGTLCALQKGGSVPLTIEEIGKMVEIAKRKSKEIRKLL